VQHSASGKQSRYTDQVFELLETLRWTDADGFFLLDRHMARLQRSADYFKYGCDVDATKTVLERAVAGAQGAWRVRLLVAPNGTARVETARLEPFSEPVRIVLASAPIDPANPFLHHKTTNRQVYERATHQGFDDVVLWNPQEQVTETTIANLVVELDGRKLTPPLDCGLLGGTFREELLHQGTIQAAPISIADLRRATRVWLINSVRGWYAARLYGENATATTPTSTSSAMPTSAKRIQR